MLMIAAVLAIVFVIIPVAFALFAVLAAVLSGLGVLFISGAAVGEGILPGILLGYLLVRAYRKNRMTETMAE